MAGMVGLGAPGACIECSAPFGDKSGACQALVNGALKSYYKASAKLLQKAPTAALGLGLA